jgi:glycosyltransferase involved in cell wall biosynthesis
MKSASALSSRIIVFNPGLQGGIVKYAWHQAEELTRLGNNVLVLCDEGAQQQAPRGAVLLDELVPDLPTADDRERTRRMLSLVKQLVWNQFILFRSVWRFRPNVVLLASYCEYLSPVWVWLQLVAAKACGVSFVAVLHDPVRNFVVGPSWWHKLSVRMAYWPLSAVFVHQEAPPEAEIPSKVRVYEVPHGMFPVGKPTRSREDFRGEWRIPEEAIVFLSFGFIRDSKNLDLLIRALPDNPAAYLVVAGRVQSESINRPVAFYEQLARDLNVSQRVKFIEEFIPDDEIVGYFEAADVLALTYSASFRSQSGVLNTAAHVDKPLLASCGPGPLRDCVEKFGLGEFLAPDDAHAVSAGMAQLIDFISAGRAGEYLPAGSPRMDWSGYREYASWDRNARIVMESIAGVRQRSTT